ncbi:uncharacterized protein LOC112589989 [Harpegnathos saltator]|uniref:uncharacterized protein LOC112589989 n=1 Tax=Harpegnathos saltator TaxID=610380 RepID=UPI000DBED5B1|nr:uncharacterized protein LOC112589989 [Harpegnathos saltator]
MCVSCGRGRREIIGVSSCATIFSVIRRFSWHTRACSALLASVSHGGFREFANMRIHSGGKGAGRLEDLKRGYHKCLTFNIKKYLSGWFYVYCKNTTLHGFRYITAAGSTILESALWSVVCTFSVTFCVVLMLRLWQNYSRNPIATTIDTSNLIWDLPFPAVTLCNNNKIYRPHAEMIAKQLQMNGIAVNETELFFSSLLRLVRPDKVLINDTTATHILDILGMTVETLMSKVMYSRAISIGRSNCHLPIVLSDSF